MSKDIVAVTITEYNTKNFPTDLSFTVSASDIIEDTELYNVCVRKLEVPINSKYMPINSITDSFVVTIFNEYKEIDKIIPDLEYGLNVFEIPGPIYSVQSFLKSVNDIVFKKPSPVELGYFDLDEKNNIFYQYNEKFTNEHDMIKIYFDSKLRRLFSFNYDPLDKIGDSFRFKAVANFVPTTENSIKVIDQQEFTYPLFYNLKAIRVRTTLPITTHKVFSSANKSAEEAALLADITFNSAIMYDSRNLLYIPNNFTYSSMSQTNVLRAFQLSFYYFYADGTEIAVKLEPLDYASVSLSFEKKQIIPIKCLE